MKTILFTLILCLSSFLDALADGNDVVEVLSIAQKGYKNYLEKIPKGREALYGFNDRTEFAIAEIGKVYEIITLNKYFFSSDGLSDRDYLIPAGEWRVAISVKGECRILLTVARLKAGWEIVGIGATGLAKELDVFERKYPSAEKAGLLLKVYQLSSDFVFFPSSTRASDYTVYPLATAKAVLGKSEALELSLPEVLLLIKNKVDH